MIRLFHILMLLEVSEAACFLVFNCFQFMLFYGLSFLKIRFFYSFLQYIVVSINRTSYKVICLLNHILWCLTFCTFSHKSILFSKLLRAESVIQDSAQL